MTRHLVSKLDRHAQLLLRDELVARLRIADSAISEWRGQHRDVPQPQVELVYAKLVDAALAGFGFCVEEARNAVATDKAQQQRRPGGA